MHLFRVLLCVNTASSFDAQGHPCSAARTHGLPLTTSVSGARAKRSLSGIRTRRIRFCRSSATPRCRCVAQTHHSLHMCVNISRCTMRHAGPSPSAWRLSSAAPSNLAYLNPSRLSSSLSHSRRRFLWLCAASEAERFKWQQALALCFSALPKSGTRSELALPFSSLPDTRALRHLLEAPSSHSCRHSEACRGCL